MKFERFEIAKNHIKLLKRMYVSWNDGEAGSPTIDCKRPYGNSDVVMDIAKIVGVATDKDGNISSCVERQLWLLHQEMETVLQICVSNNGVKEGIYETTKEYDSASWRRKRKK